LESYNTIEDACHEKDCDLIVRFSKPELMGKLGVMEQTYYEMGSFQSPSCIYKSPKVQKMEVVYKKSGSQFRANRVPTYGPVGINSCIHQNDRPYENYSMLKDYESLSLAKKYCNMYPECDIIVEIDRSRVAGPGLRKLYEIGNTKSRIHCQPRPQNGVEVKRMQFKRANFRTNQYNGPKRRAVVDFKCLVIGEPESDISRDNSSCKQVFDTIETANLACSLFEKCVLIGQNSDRNFELFAESDDDASFDLEEYNLSIPTMDKTRTSLIYDFMTILNHENMAITQITAYDAVMNTSFTEVPKHGTIPESTHLNFYDQNLSVVIQEKTCVIRHPEPLEKLTEHIATTIDYKIEKQHGNLDVDEGEYALSDLSNLRDELPRIAQKQCYGKALIGLDFDLKQFGHDTDFGAKFFFLNETEASNTEDSLSRSKRVVQPMKTDPLTKKEGTITECNGKNACGDPNFMAAICAKESCGTLFCQFIRRGLVKKPGDQKIAVIEAPFVSWNHIIKQGYWCMPCCILEDNVHIKMKTCSSLPTQEDICKQQKIHGRCGIEFDP